MTNLSAGLLHEQLGLEDGPGVGLGLHPHLALSVGKNLNILCENNNVGRICIGWLTPN